MEDGRRSIAGLNALVTGGAVRIGRSIAEALASQGAHVAIHYRTSGEEATALVERFHTAGLRSGAFQADLAEPSQALALGPRVEEQMGPLDILVLSASEYPERDPATIGIEDLEHTIRTNLTTPFLLAHQIGYRMQARGRGRIVTLLDWSIGRPDPKYLSYHISKAGLREATLGLARALAPAVQVNGIAPGAVLLPEGTPEERARRIQAKVPLRRLGSAEDIAMACLYLLEGGDFVTGSVITVDGGRSVV
jgi:NAD(P)-dependent dehydrogenase (short-subunit alcohol dehydrogenase family)